MKRLLLALVFVLAITNGYCQFGIGIGMGGVGMRMNVPLNSNRQRGENIEKQVQQLKHDLNLNDSQVVKVRSLLVERDRRRNEKEPMTNTEFNHRLEDILTPEQYTRFDEIRKQKQQQRQQQGQTQTPQPNSNDYKPNAEKKDWDDIYK